jgi:hypothetical protein
VRQRRVQQGFLFFIWRGGAILLFQVKSNFFQWTANNIGIAKNLSHPQCKRIIIFIKFDLRGGVCYQQLDGRNSGFGVGKIGAVESLSLAPPKYFSWCFITVWCGLGRLFTYSTFCSLLDDVALWAE